MCRFDAGATRPQSLTVKGNVSFCKSENRMQMYAVECGMYFRSKILFSRKKRWV